MTGTCEASGNGAAQESRKAANRLDGGGKIDAELEEASGQ